MPSAKPSIFQSTPPVKAATARIEAAEPLSLISIHAAREGGDDVDKASRIPPKVFQSTPPVKAATERRAKQRARVGISIHAAREGGDINVKDVIIEPVISIHAAREGGDNYDADVRQCYRDFNPRRP